MSYRRRRTDRQVDWFRVGVIAALGVLLIVLFIALGKVKGSWIIPSANAAEATLTWTPPTKNCDGTALTNLTGYDMTYGQAREVLPLTPLTKTVTGLKPGKWWFSLAALSPTDRSEFVTVEKVIQPEEFVTTAPTAYVLIKRANRLVAAPVGTAPLGTICDATQPVLGYYVIPKEAVALTGTVKPDLVVAKCD
jgi:hypothetical protein